MRHPRRDAAWARTRVGYMTALGNAIELSIIEPHKIFWIVVLPSFGPRRKVMGFTIHSPECILDDKPKYTVCTVMNGEVLGRRRLLH